jgi:epoxyqueuosine reductase QueG
MLCGGGEFWDKIHAVSFWAASTTSLHNYSHLVLVELDLVVVFRVVVLVDIVATYVSNELYAKGIRRGLTRARNCQIGHKLG